MTLRWSRVPSLPTWDSIAHPGKSAYVSEGGEFRVSPTFARGYGGRRLKRAAWVLTEGGKRVGSTFQTAQMAKAFAEALRSLGNDLSARREFIRHGGAWCFRWEREKRLTKSTEAVPFIYIDYASVDNGRRTSFTFKWWGGEYVDISPTYGGTSFEVINVWDPETDKPRIAKTQSAFERRCREWLKDAEPNFQNYEEAIRDAR